MGYGLGATFLAVGLILAFAIQDRLEGVDLTALGYILAGVGGLILALTALSLNRGTGVRSIARTTHPDGSQTVKENEANRI
jgi:hypothetical protein